MKRAIVVVLIVLFVVAVLFVPIPSNGKDDTKIYTALTYRVIKWHETDGRRNLEFTKIYFPPKCYKDIDKLSEEEYEALGEDVPDTQTDAETEAPETEKPDITLYDGEWVEKSENTKIEDTSFSDLVIEEIYTDCFIATPIIPLPIRYKVNWEYSGKWCVGDHVSCTCENCYLDGDRCEGDLVNIESSDFETDPDVAYKPVIYLYPEKKTDVSVRLGNSVDLTCAYPEYSDGWTVTASCDGTLTDDKGETYNYLYWEGETKIDFDFSKGFCVRGSDTASFLEKALSDAGLTRREANEFIVYWLPLMQDNEYNVISFQGASYTDAAPLEVSPSPDTEIRVFMAWYPIDEPIDVEPQILTGPERSGFTVVEWGGTEVCK